MKLSYRTRRIISVVLVLAGVGIWLAVSPGSYETEVIPAEDSVEPLGVSSGSCKSNDEDSASDANNESSSAARCAKDVLETLEIKGRAPKTGYARTEFYNNWPNVDGCSLRQIIIKRELGDSAVLDGCDVVGGTFTEPYTGNVMTFYQKSDFSSKIQIDHIVALSDAWQKGAQYKSADERYQMATDPLNLIAVDSSANQQKSDGDAATWLPPNKAFRCQYVARQVSVKSKYGLWVTQAEHDAIANVLASCPSEPVVGI